MAETSDGAADRDDVGRSGAKRLRARLDLVLEAAAKMILEAFEVFFLRWKRPVLEFRIG
jgi:hypothetical protein